MTSWDSCVDSIRRRWQTANRAVVCRVLHHPHASRLFRITATRRDACNQAAGRTSPDCQGALDASIRLSRAPRFFSAGSDMPHNNSRSRQCPSPDERTHPPNHLGSERPIPWHYHGAFETMPCSSVVESWGSTTQSKGYRQDLTAIVDRDPAIKSELCLRTAILIQRRNVPSTVLRTK